MEKVKLFLMIGMGLLLLWISFYDLKKGIIPNGLIIVGICLNLGYTILTEPTFTAVMCGLARGLTAALPVLGLVLIMDRWLKSPSMGGGDLKLIFMLGMTTVPMMSLLALLTACLSALLFCLVTGRKKNAVLPFGPALCFGWLVTWLLNPYSADWLGRMQWR